MRFKGEIWMTKQLRRALVLVVPVLIATSAVALAAGPLKGGTYRGTTAHGREAISLKVSRSGKTVTVSVPEPPGYSSGCGGPATQKTKAAGISGGGSFSGSITYEFPLIRKPVAKLIFSGRFSGRTVKGTVRSQFTYSRACSGSTSFSAKAS
jgi:hypothetical protein